MTRPAWDEFDAESYGEMPETICRCDNCGRSFALEDGCECWPITEAELGVAS